MKRESHNEVKAKTPLEWERDTWREFRRVLNPKDQTIFDQIWKYSFVHERKGLQWDRINTTDLIWMASLIEQQKQIDQMRLEIERRNEKKRKKLF